MSTYLDLVLKDLKQYQVSSEIRNTFHQLYNNNNSIDPSTYISREFKDFLEYIDHLKEAYPSYESRITINALADRNMIEVFMSPYYFMVSDRLDILKENSKTMLSDPSIFKSFLHNLLNSEYDKNHLFFELVNNSQIDNLNFLIDFGRKNNLFAQLNTNDLMTKNEDFINIFKNENLLSNDKFSLDDFKSVFEIYSKNYGTIINTLNKLFTAYFDNFLEEFKTPQDFIDYKEKHFRTVTIKNDKEEISYKMDEVDFLESFGIVLKINEKKILQTDFLKSWLKNPDIKNVFLDSKEKMMNLLSHQPDVFIEFVNNNFDELVKRTINSNFEYYGALSWDFQGRSYRRKDNVLTQIHAFFSDDKNINNFNKEDFNNLFDLTKKFYKGVNDILSRGLESVKNQEEKEKHIEMKGYAAYSVLAIAKHLHVKVGLNEENINFLNDVLKDNGKILEGLCIKPSHCDDLIHFSEHLLSFKDVESLNIKDIDMGKIVVSNLNDIINTIYGRQIEIRFNNVLNIMNSWGLESKIHDVPFKNKTFEKNIGTGRNTKSMYDFPLLFVALGNKKIFNEVVVDRYLDDLKNIKYKGKNYFEYLLNTERDIVAKEALMSLSEKPEIFNELVVKNKKIKTSLEKKYMNDVLNVFSVIENYFKVNKKLKQKKEEPVSSSSGFKI